jgi:hypothetical protein
VTEIPLKDTLLLDSVIKGKARFVSDCALYLQSCMRPAPDIFISGSQMVASIVVLPLIHNHVAFGGVYFTLDTPSNFQHMKVRGSCLGVATRSVSLWCGVSSTHTPVLNMCGKHGRCRGDGTGQMAHQQCSRQARAILKQMKV